MDWRVLLKDDPLVNLINKMAEITNMTDKLLNDIEEETVLFDITGCESMPGLMKGIRDLGDKELMSESGKAYTGEKLIKRMNECIFLFITGQVDDTIKIDSEMGTQELAHIPGNIPALGGNLRQVFRSILEKDLNLYGPFMRQAASSKGS